MALFTMIIRKMIKNKWLVISLFIGMLLTSALVSTMPIYSESILSRMLVKDLEQLQLDRNQYPTTHYTRLSFTDANKSNRIQIMADIDQYMRNVAAPGFQLPVRELVMDRQTKLMTLQLERTEVDSKKAKPTASIKSSNQFADHIELIDGHLPAATLGADGIYEVMVNQKTLLEFNCVLGDVIKLDDNKGGIHLRVKPVGVFRNKLEDDLYFRDIRMTEYNRNFVMNEDLFQQDLVTGNKAIISLASWYFVLDYTKMELREVDPFLETNKQIKTTILAKVAAYQAEFTVPAIPTIEEYFQRSARLNKLMWSLHVPVLIMLAFYMFMVSNLIVDRQKNEIAILRSRGAARWQIILSFAIEGLLLSGAALLAGPYIAMLLTQALGASNGFLQFVQRASLSVHVSTKSFAYAAIASGISFIMTLIPVWSATHVTIVGHKQQMARMQKIPFWHKSFLDVLLLAISIYGLYSFRARLKNLLTLGLRSDDLKIEPLQFVVPALFIVGAGLLLLRLYPLLLQLIYRIGRRWWPPSWYATLIQVGRSNSQYQFLMIFLIITIATGVFSAGAARTLNNNIEERLRYAEGADFSITTQWPNDAPPPPMSGGPGAASPAATTIASKTIHYTEPPFEPFTELPGVESTAKVFMKQDALFSTSDNKGTATLMGIDTDDFGRTAWFPDHLLDYPLNDYLNLLATDSRAVLISESLANQKKLKKGDTLW
ncbi:MAG: FtsX-like permease family protein, partial [Gorillibacterium sp.]|nr:FtsX-like permease family protein [Gorillibacterium sp.]